MARNLSGPLITAITSRQFMPVFLVTLTFKSKTEYVWNGIGTLTYGGNAYKGVGSLGKFSGVQEGVEVKADGTSVTLSGIDADLFDECVTDIQPNLAAQVLFSAWDIVAGGLIGTPYPLFVGQIGDADVNVDGETISITLRLENKMIQLQRATNRRYTSADQNIPYPDDSGFAHVEILNDVALRWGN